MARSRGLPGERRAALPTELGRGRIQATLRTARLDGDSTFTAKLRRLRILGERQDGGGTSRSLLGRGQRQLCQAGHAASVFAAEAGNWVELFHLPGDLCVIARRVKERDGAAAGTPGQDCRPGRRDIISEGVEGPHAGDDHSLRHARGSYVKYLRSASCQPGIG